MKVSLASNDLIDIVTRYLPEFTWSSLSDEGHSEERLT